MELVLVELLDVELLVLLVLVVDVDLLLVLLLVELPLVLGVGVVLPLVLVVPPLVVDEYIATITKFSFTGVVVLQF